jgi:hypothetical protein
MKVSGGINVIFVFSFANVLLRRTFSAAEEFCTGKLI